MTLEKLPALQSVTSQHSEWHEIVDAEELAKRLNVPESWVYEQVRTRATDPMPHLRLGKYVRFQPGSPEFKAWLEKHRVGSAQTRRV